MSKKNCCGKKSCKCKVCKCTVSFKVSVLEDISEQLSDLVQKCSPKAKKCKVCGRSEMLTADGRCVNCGYPPGSPLHNGWRKLQRKLLPKRRAEDRKFIKLYRDFARRLETFKKSIKPKKHIDI